MKKITLKFICAAIASAALLSLTACGGGKTPADTTASVPGDTSGTVTTAGGSQTAKSLVFVHNGVTVKMNEEADPIIEALGTPTDTYEAPSCAFQGKDYYYNYGSFEVSAYEENGVHHIYSVFLKDDLVTTPEGVAIGSSEAEVTAAYPGAAKNEAGSFVIRGDGVILTIVVKDGSVSSIEYVADVEG